MGEGREGQNTGQAPGSSTARQAAPSGWRTSRVFESGDRRKSPPLKGCRQGSAVTLQLAETPWSRVWDGAGESRKHPLPIVGSPGAPRLGLRVPAPGTQDRQGLLGMRPGGWLPCPVPSWGHSGPWSTHQEGPSDWQPDWHRPGPEGTLRSPGDFRRWGWQPCRSLPLLPSHRLGSEGAGPRGPREAGTLGSRAWGVGVQMEGPDTLTPNICRRSGSLNRKGMLETCSRLGCCFSVGSEGWSGWLSVCAASSVCCGDRSRMVRRPLPSAPTPDQSLPKPPGLPRPRICTRQGTAGPQPQRSHLRVFAGAVPTHVAAGQASRPVCAPPTAPPVHRGLTSVVPRLSWFLGS